MSYSQKIEDARTTALKRMGNLAQEHKDEIAIALARNNDSQYYGSGIKTTDIDTLRREQELSRDRAYYEEVQKITSLSEAFKSAVNAQYAKPMSDTARNKLQDLKMQGKELSADEFTALADTYGKEPGFLDTLRELSPGVDDGILFQYPAMSDCIKAIEDKESKIRGELSEVSRGNKTVDDVLAGDTLLDTIRTQMGGMLLTEYEKEFSFATYTQLY